MARKMEFDYENPYFEMFKQTPNAEQAEKANLITEYLLAHLSDTCEITPAPAQCMDYEVGVVNGKLSSDVFVTVYFPDLNGGWDLVVYDTRGDTRFETLRCAPTDVEVLRACAKKFDLHVEFCG